MAYRASLGVKVERVMTDDGSCYLSRAVGQTCNKLGLKHIRTKPYTSKTNGKAERFIQTSLRECAYARASDSSDQRTAELPRWLFIATTGTDPAAASAPIRPSAASRWTGTTC
jgi:transposase InsO family protein